RADGTVERLGTLGGLPLAMIEGGIYKSDAVELAAGDRLLILTDGFTEAADPAGALFGEPRIAALLAAADDAPVLNKLAAEVRVFEAGQPASDDMAAILFRID